MSSHQHRRTALARRIRARELTVAPGVFDMISARVADRAGFDALYMTGYGIAASHMGLPDAGLVSYSEMVGRAARICESTRTPLIADADTGFGGLLNVRHTVRGYEAAGVAAIQIEDQEFPKKCGHAPGAGGPARRHAAQGRGRGGRAGQRRLPRHRAYRLAQLAGARRGDSPAGGNSRGRVRRGVHRSPRDRGRVRAHRPGNRRALLANMVEGGFSPSCPRSLSHGWGSQSRYTPARVSWPLRRRWRRSTGISRRRDRPSISRPRASQSAKCTS